MLRAIIPLAAGCSSQIPPEELTTAAIGPYPDKYDAAVKAYLDRVLLDSTSARVKYVAPPDAGRVWVGLVNGGWLYGYVVLVDVNAKNSFGGYTGWQRWQFLLRNDEVKYAIGPQSY